ncbi:MAG: DUF58 domain-containing protein, partial [Stenotrophomonas sp.]
VEVELLLLLDPLEISPPHCVLPLATQAGRLQLDLTASAVRDAWHDALIGPVEDLCRRLPGRRIRVSTLVTDDASDVWLGAAPNRSVG